MRLAHDKHPAWKGEYASYAAKHMYVRLWMGKAPFCQLCPRMESLQWANIDGCYSRNLEEYIPLCAPCHKEYDLARLAAGEPGKNTKESLCR